MTTPTPIPDFCVSSQADGFDEFLKVFNKHFRKSYIGNLSYYGYLKTESYCGKERLFAPLITPSSAIALLTKPLTEGDLIVGNMFECIETSMDGRINFIKGNIYTCSLNGTIPDERGYAIKARLEFLNRHFKLIQPVQEESVIEFQNKVIDISTKEVSDLTNQLLSLQQENESMKSEIERLRKEIYHKPFPL